eukprot:284974_1
MLAMLLHMSRHTRFTPRIIVANELSRFLQIVVFLNKCSGRNKVIRTLAHQLFNQVAVCAEFSSYNTTVIKGDIILRSTGNTRTCEEHEACQNQKKQFANLRLHHDRMIEIKAKEIND